VLTATIQRDSVMATFAPPAALVMPAGGSLKGEVDARAAEGACGPGSPKAGVVTDPEHGLTVLGSIWGPGNDIPNEPGPDIWQRGVAPPSRALLDGLAFTPAELAALRSLATARGTLFSGHPTPKQFGSILTAGGGAPARLPDGLVYVEGDVEIEAYDGTWTGWLVVVPGIRGTGTIRFTCFAPCDAAHRSLTLNGLLYATDTLTVETPATNRSLAINGAVITLQSSLGANTINPRTVGDFRLTFDCDRVRRAFTGTAETTGVEVARRGWSLKRGTFRETSGP
jgi:hypothetical protein